MSRKVFLSNFTQRMSLNFPLLRNRIESQFDEYMCWSITAIVGLLMKILCNMPGKRILWGMRHECVPSKNQCVLLFCICCLNRKFFDQKELQITFLLLLDLPLIQQNCVL